MTNYDYSDVDTDWTISESNSFNNKLVEIEDCDFNRNKLYDGRVDYASLIEFELMRVLWHGNTFANNNCMKDGDKNSLVTDAHDTGGCITLIDSTLLVYDESAFQENKGSYIIGASRRKETFENENITNS